MRSILLTCSLFVLTVSSVEINHLADDPVPNDQCPIDEDPRNPTHLPHADCTKFYKCLEGYAHVLDCPSGLWWNSVANYCDFPANTNCATDGLQRNEKSGSPQSAANELVLWFFRHADCFKFYSCDEGIIQECPTGLWFDSRSGRCEWPQNSDCQNARKNNYTRAGSVGMENPTYFPHADCSKFYVCTQGRLIACPPGLWFNEELQYCDYPETSGCSPIV